MKCPSCGKPPVSLKLWLLKYSWAHWSCDYCKILLKANKVTWIFILGALIYALSIFVLFLFPGIFWMEGCLSDSPLKRLMISMLLLLVPLAGTAFLSYFVCGYKLAKPATGKKSHSPLQKKTKKTSV